MALKAEIDAQTLASLPEAVAQHYREVSRSGHRAFILEIERPADLPEEIVGALRRARDHERGARRVAEAEVKRLEQVVAAYRQRVEAGGV